MSTILISGGTVLDPASQLTAICNVLIADGIVQCIGSTSESADYEIEASGLLVTPGLIDAHVHLREPGQKHKEDIQSGTAAAVAGGFTAVACMPNTDPPIDNGDTVNQIATTASGQAYCRVYPVGCLTQGRRGEALADYDTLIGCGVHLFSDDGDGVACEDLMEAALARLHSLGAIAIQHCEDPSYPSGVMHLGTVSESLGVAGMDPRSEEDMIARDIRLASKTGARYHVAHISTARAVELVRRAKARGVNVTAEVCPHHLMLTEEACRNLDPNTKMHPPLRTDADVQACIEGVLDGTIDFLVTDHAPHAASEKERGFLEAPPGIVGLETSLGCFATVLVDRGHLGWMELVDKMSNAPARTMGLPGGKLQEGLPADITIIDPNLRWKVNADQFHSKSRNTPFNATSLLGKAVYTIVGGEVRFGNGKLWD